MSGDSKVIIGQIHTKTPEFEFPVPVSQGGKRYYGIPAIVLSYEPTIPPANPPTGVIKVTVKDSPTDPSANADTAFTFFPNPVARDAQITYSLQLVGTGTSVKLFARVNGEKPKDPVTGAALDFIDMSTTDPAWANVNTTFYFKAGSYYPENVGSGTAIVTFSSLSARHEE